MSHRQPWRAAQDDWTTDGARIDSPERSGIIRRTLEESGPIMVEWRHYRGASAPDRLIFDDYETYVSWLAGVAPGDSICVWNIESICTDDAALTHGKQPDDDGAVPLKGSY